MSTEASKLDPESPEYLKTLERMEQVANGLQDIFPGYGFCLMVFPFGGPEGFLNYISNANREDMIATIKAWVADMEGRMVRGSTTEH